MISLLALDGFLIAAGHRRFRDRLLRAGSDGHFYLAMTHWCEVMYSYDRWVIAAHIRARQATRLPPGAAESSKEMADARQ